MGIGARIKEARLNAGLTQEELAKELEITKGAVANYETGVSSPKMNILYKIFDVLDVNANYLFQDEMSAETKDQILLEKYHNADEGTRNSIDKLLDISKE